MENDITEAGWLYACLPVFPIITFSTATNTCLLTTNYLQAAYLTH